MTEAEVLRQENLLLDLGFEEISTRFISDIAAEHIGDALSQMFSRDVAPQEFLSAMRKKRPASFMLRNEVFLPAGSQSGAIAHVNGTSWGRSENLTPAECDQLIAAGFINHTRLMQRALRSPT